MTPERIDHRYELLRHIGGGGMGSVYEAYDRLTGQTVALKRVKITADPAEAASSGRTVSDHLHNLRLALAGEFSTLAGLRHQHIISVLDYGFDAAGEPYFTMDLLANAQPITGAGQYLSQGEALRLLIELLLALAYLHRRGVIHRDLKPSNVMVDSGGLVRTLDFGLATQLAGREMQDDEGGVSGTLTHIAPELLAGHPPSAASDLYAVGVIGYQLLTGAHPFDTSSSQHLLHDILYSAPDLSRVPEVVDPLTPTERTTQAARVVPDSPTLPPARVVDEDAPTQIGRLLSAVEVETPPDPDHAIPPTSVLAAAPIITPAGSVGRPYAGDPPASEAPTTPTLRTVIGRLLHKDPAQRYGEADTVIADLCAAAGLTPPVETAGLRRSYLEAARFVGREAELAALNNALDDMIGRRTSAGGRRAAGYLLAGESGVGKSRLLDELRVRAMVGGALTVRGQAVDGGGLPYQTWRDPVRRLILSVELSDLEAGTLRALVPDIADLIGRRVADAPELPGPAAQQRLALTVVELFKRQTRPILLILEDLHWADESLEILKALARFAAGMKLMIVGSFRDDERADLPAQFPLMKVVKLDRLEAEAVTELSASMLGDVGRSPALVELLQRETEGNTFFMVEIVRALAEEAGSLRAINIDALPQTVMAGGVQQIVRRRLARVPDAAQMTLKLAAVAGRRIDLDLLSAAMVQGELAYDTFAALAALDHFLSACAAAAVIEIYDNAWRFSHDKIRAGVLADLGEDERAALHRLVALALESQHPGEAARRERAEVLMQHWRGAGDAGRELRYLEWAAQAFVANQAEYSRALALSERGLALTDALGDDEYRQKLHNIAATAYEVQGKLDQCGQHRHIALALAESRDDEKGQVEALLGLASIARLRSLREESLTLAKRALALAEACGDTLGIARSYDSMGGMYVNLGEFDPARNCFMHSITLYRSLGDQRRMAMGYMNLVVIASNTGDFALAKEYLHQSMAIFRETGERRAQAQGWNNLGVIAANEGDLVGARDYLVKGLHIQREIGDRHTEVATLNNLGSISDYLGDYPSASAYYGEALALAEEIEDWRMTATVLVGLSKVQIAQGDHEAGRASALKALGLALAHNVQFVMTEGLVKLAQLAIHAGDHARAAEYLGLADAHPATYAEVRQLQIAPLRAELARTLSPDQLDAATARGAGLELEAVVRAILDDETTP